MKTKTKETVSADEFRSRIRDADKLTHVSFTMGAKQMRSECFTAEEYTDHRFFAVLKEACLQSDAGTFKISGQMTSEARTSDKWYGVMCTRKEEKFTYKYIGLVGYTWNSIYGLIYHESNRRRPVIAAFLTIWNMKNRKFRDAMRKYMRQWLWRQIPRFLVEEK